MANRVIQLTNLNPQPTSNYKLEKWVDIDMDSVRNQNHKSVEFPMLSDYVMWLGTELGTSSLEPTENNLSVFAVDGQDPDDDMLSAIAVTLKIGYDTAYMKYQKWAKPYRWRVSKLVNVKAVQNSLKNIFTWIPGERILNPEFGSKLKQYLYEGITQDTSEKIVAEIKHCVSEWEPRVTITSVVDASTIEDHEDNVIHLEIKYTIPQLSDKEYSYSFYYNRGE